MFTEDSINQANRQGWIEVITGSMFSGKTEELIRRIKRARLANQQVSIFKPLIDTRFSNDNVVSHDENIVLSTPAGKAVDTLTLSKDSILIGIDEAQFFDNTLSDVCINLANMGKRVIIAGLDMDYLGKPFGPMPELLAIAEFITKVHAICLHCGNLAQYTHRKTADTQQVLLGEKNIYEPLCRKCYQTALNIE